MKLPILAILKGSAMKQVIALLLGLGLVLGQVAFVGAKVIYVDQRAAGANTGDSWQDAFTSLTSALAAARAGDLIRCAGGTYRPAQSARSSTFSIPNGVTIEGGYAGMDGPDPDIRDIQRYKTILSGDMANDDTGITDPCQLWSVSWRQDNAYNVVTVKNADPATILDGLVIRAGHETRTGNPRLDGGPGGGGGMVIEGGAPVIRNCRFEANAGRTAGALLVINASAVITGCVFEGNYAFGEGGAIVCKSGAVVRLSNCVLAYNLAGADGGAVVQRDSGNMVLEGCRLIGNISAGNGGAVLLSNSGLTLDHCLIAGNKASGRAGAIEFSAAGPSDRLSLLFCTVTGNRAASGSAVHIGQVPQKAVSASNCIFWDNGDQGPGLFCKYCNDSDPRFAIQGYWDQAGRWVNGEYHLKSQAGRWDPISKTWVYDDVTSPCIDAGDPNWPIGFEPFPNGGIVNLGVYGGTSQASKSYFGSPCQTIVAGDINGDCIVDAKDLQFLGLNWLRDQRQHVYIKWLGHAAFKIWTSDVVIYIDPYRITDSPRDGTYVLCTHSHGDHYSPADIARVGGSGMQLIGPKDVITSYGKGVAMMPGQTVNLGTVSVIAVAAYNINKPNHPKANNWLGFVIEIAGRRLYHAGDTDLIPEMSTLGRIDVAMLPAGGTYTMNATEAATATSYIQPGLAIPMHWGTIVGSAADAATFAQKASCPVQVMSPGQTIEI